MFQNGSFVVWSDDSICHSEMADRMDKVDSYPISAGFVKYDGTGDVECYGKSLTLKIESQDRDTVILNNYLKRGAERNG